MSLCGVDDNVVAYEYSLTEVGLTNEWKETVLEHLMSHPALRGNMEGAENLISARCVAYILSLRISMVLLLWALMLYNRKANMLATLKMLREKFGGAENYIIEKCGLSKEEVEKIRKNLIVKEPAVHDKVQDSL